MKKTGTTDNCVDMFTNLVSHSKFKHCLDLLNISSCWFSPRGPGSGHLNLRQRERVVYLALGECILVHLVWKIQVKADIC